MEQVDLRDVFKKASKCVCTSAVKSTANVEMDPNDCEPTDGGGIQVKY